MIYMAVRTAKSENSFATYEYITENDQFNLLQVWENNG